jgi:hypothetical protein
MLNLKPKELVIYIIIVYILRYVIYYIVDYIENKDYPEDEKKYKNLEKFKLMNKIIEGVKGLLIKIGLIRVEKEGFQTYQQCRNLGYSKEFCVQTPVSVFGPAGCMCPDGRMGATYPGLRGGCLCTTMNTPIIGNINYY